jgi:hypothetical protein
MKLKSEKHSNSIAKVLPYIVNKPQQKIDHQSEPSAIELARRKRKISFRVYSTID